MSTQDTPTLVQWAWSLVRTDALKKSAFNRADAQCLADAHWLCEQGLDRALIIQRMNTEPLSGAAGFRTQRTAIEEAKKPRRFGASGGSRKAAPGRSPSTRRRYQPGDDSPSA